MNYAYSISNSLTLKMYKNFSNCVFIWSEPPPSTPVYTYSNHCLRQFWEMNRRWIGKKNIYFMTSYKEISKLNFENSLTDLSVFSIGSPRTICPELQLCMGLFTLQHYKLIESRSCVLFIFSNPFHTFFQY